MTELHPHVAIDQRRGTACPFQIGQRVRVRETAKYAADFPGDAYVVGIVWEYQRLRRRYNIWLAYEGEIAAGLGATDGWRPEDLEAV